MINRAHAGRNYVECSSLAFLRAAWQQPGTSLFMPRGRPLSKAKKGGAPAPQFVTNAGLRERT